MARRFALQQASCKLVFLVDWLEKVSVKIRSTPSDSQDRCKHYRVQNEGGTDVTAYAKVTGCTELGACLRLTHPDWVWRPRELVANPIPKAMVISLVAISHEGNGNAKRDCKENIF